MQHDLTDRVALVTGATRGIGYAVAQDLIAAGARVLVVGRDEDRCADAAARLGDGAIGFAAHVGDPEQLTGCVEAALDRWGRIDVLVNNAGINPYMGPTLGIDLGRWEKLLQVNLTGPLFLSQLVWDRSMSERSGSSIINVASTAGTGTGPLGPYGVTKAALVHLTAQLAAELGPRVRVNAVAPGVVRTDFARPMWESPNAEQALARYPMRRFGEPADIARAVTFLASDAAAWITGQTLVLDGGRQIALQ